MQSDPERFSRRHFLQWSAAGAAAAGTGWLTPNDEAQEPLADGERTAPQHPLVLRSAQLEVTLDAASGLPWKYRLSSSNAALWGETFGTPVTVTVCRTEPWSFQTAPLIPEGHHATHTTVSFRFAARFGGSLAVHFTLHYRIDGPTLFVAMEAVEESAPFQLIDVALPGLVTVRESDEGAWLAHGDEGGSLAMLAQAKTWQPSAQPVLG